MLARVVLVLSLAAVMVFAGLLAHVVSLPRRASQADSLLLAERRAAQSTVQPDPQRVVQFTAPVDLVAALPAQHEGPQVELETVDEAIAAQSAEPPTVEQEPQLLEQPAKVAQLPPATSGAGAPNQPASLNMPLGESTASVEVEPGEDEVIALMRALHDGAQREQAQAELRGLGFKPEHIELAARFTDSSAAIRAEAVRSLPAVRGIVARDWFLWASRDEDPGVRLIAVALMATTNDAELLTRVAELAVRDADPAVREAAQRARR